MSTQAIRAAQVAQERLRAEVRELEAEVARLKQEIACPCHQPRSCILCGRTEPCGLLPPGAAEGDEPICTMEPETYGELVERVRTAYGVAATLRAHVRELKQDAARLNWLDTLTQRHGWHGWEVLPEGLVMSNVGGVIREAIDAARKAAGADEGGSGL